MATYLYFVTGATRTQVADDLRFIADQLDDRPEFDNCSGGVSGGAFEVLPESPVAFKDIMKLVSNASSEVNND